MAHDERRPGRALVRAALATTGLVLGASIAPAQTWRPLPVPQSERLAVAWNDTASGSGRVALMTVHEPWALVTPPLVVGRDPVLHHAYGRLVVASPHAGTIHVVDPAAWSVLAVFDLGPDSRPLDVALAGPSRAYVTRAGATHLLRLALDTGLSTEVVDLGPYADADGVPDLGRMARHEGRLFVQIRRVNAIDPGQFTPPAQLAVVDLATEQLIDVDAELPGVQTIELAGTAPKLRMQVVRGTRRLFVGATGDFWDAGGIEMVDLDRLRSVGLVVREADGLTGADLGAFVLVGPGRGFLAFSTDFAISSHLSLFDLSGSVEPVPDIYGAVGYFAPAIARARTARLVFFPDAGYAATGVQVFDADTGVRLTTDPIPTSGPPTDLEAFLLPRRAPEPEPRR